jgi:uncharacterized repeat protein (TIGR03806 family)
VAANRLGPCSLLATSLLLLEACHGSSSDNGGGTPNPVPPGSTSGLDARPSNTMCVAPAKASVGNTAVQLERVFSNLTFSQPLALVQPPGDASRWYVVQKAGTVRVFADAASPSATTFVTLPVNSGGEGGLLGMAFHPQWATNRYIYLSFTEGSPMTSVVARFTMSPSFLTADPATRVNVIRVPQPLETNHKGGQIAFDQAGRLFFGLGDGGGGGDPYATGLDTSDLLGSLLRIDVDNGTPYAIPPDNPFASAGEICDQRAHTVSASDCPEIYAWGLRNPWRWSFDSATGDLWLGDVGQGAREEIDRMQRGGNYGWNCREGLAAYNGCATPAGSFSNPVHDYPRSAGYSVTGGYVYRGQALPQLVGRYIFGDYGSGLIWQLVPNGTGGYTAEQLLDFNNDSLASFAQGNDGELYVVDIAGGGLHKIVPAAGSAPAPPVSTLLSQTGCVNPQDPRQPASGLVPYEPAAPFWSDNATKERWLAIPNGTSIGVGGDGDFSFPAGTVLMKHFRLNGALVETRLFMRHPDGEWAGYSYEWNAQQTDATLVQAGKTVTVGQQSWIYPSGNDCLTCHTAAAGFSLGLEAAQLNRTFTYASTGRTSNQLRTLDAVTMFTTPLGDPSLQPAMPDPFDTSAPLAQRARAYLQTNCAQCHRAGGPTPSAMDLRYSTLLSSTNACGAPPQSGDLGIGAAARIVAPGSASNSVLVARMERRDASGMPPLASSIVDQAGVALVQQWIDGMTTCQ